MTPRRSRVARLIAAVGLRGREAPFLLRDLDDAFAHDLARGLTPARARRRDLRNVAATVLSVWLDLLRPSAWRPSLMDVRLGLRAMALTPGLSLVAIAALAIGIPIGLAPMHAVEALERPWAGDPDGRIRTLSYWRDTAREPATLGDFAGWQASLRSFHTLAAYRSATFTVGRGAGATPVQGLEVTASAFAILRTPALVGRVLQQADEGRGAARVAVIGYDLWQARFGGDLGVVGTVLTVDAHPHTVVGVMPAGFRFPTAQQLWLPMAEGDTLDARAGRQVAVFGALAAGVTAEAAQAELRAATATIAAAHPAAFSRLQGAVLPAWHLTFDFPSPGGLRALPEFPLMQALLLMPLLVACVNVGLLFVAQTSRRAAEFSIRTALGASRSRILTQLFVEFLVLAVTATAAGLFLLDWLAPRLVTGMGVTLPYWIDTSITIRSALRGLGLAVACAAIAGVIPAVRLTGRGIDANLKRTRAGGRYALGVTGTLIAIDVAAAVVAIGVTAGLWAKVQAARPDPAVDGVKASEILAFTLDVRSPRPEHVSGAQTALAARLRQEPGVRGVTFATALPRMDHPVVRLQPDQHGDVPLAAGAPVRVARIAPDFLEQLAQPLVAGRGFTPLDTAAAVRPVIVNTTFAQRAFGSTAIVGRRVRELDAAGDTRGAWREIVGVVGHMGTHPLTPSEDDAVYLPLRAGEVNPVRLAVWLHGDPAAFAPRIAVLAAAIDPDAVVSPPVALSELVEGDGRLLQALAAAVATLVAVLLTLATSAVYALLSLAVARRTREIGVRVALGAGPTDVVRHVAVEVLAAVAVGVLLGLPIAGALCYESLAMSGANPSVPAAMALALTVGGVVLCLVSCTACVLPVRRALAIAPMEALRKT